ncbi:MAG: hypothetical protein ABIX19_18150 [Gemmatimonadaceae bacterium]
MTRHGGWARGTVDFDGLGTFARAERAVVLTNGVANAEASVVIGNGRPIPARERFARDGYATRIGTDEPRPLYQPDYFNWYYARLDGLLVDHWIDASFLANNDLGIGSDGNGLTITFCGRDHRRPFIEGTMELSADTLFSHVAFRYVTPPPREEAASEVWFSATRDRVLWPVRSIFYRQSSPAGAWFQEAWINLDWCAWDTYAVALARGVPELATDAKKCFVRH